jgi:putative MATE family efflux protein
MGAALATLGTQSLAAIIGFSILLKGKYGIHLSIRDFKPDYVFMKRAFFLGLPASIEQSTRALGLTVMTFLIATFGTLTVAAYGAGSNILQLVMIPALGLAMSISTLVGQNIGAGNIKRAEQIGRLGALIGFGSLTVIGVIVFIFAPNIISFFIPHDPAVVAEGAKFLRISSLSWGFIGVQFGLSGVLRGSGNLITTMTLALISQWVLQLPLAYVLSKHTSLGTSGLWWALSITNVVIASITMAWCAKGDWKKTKLTAEEQLTEKVSEEIIIEEGAR